MTFTEQMHIIMYTTNVQPHLYVLVNAQKVGLVCEIKIQEGVVEIVKKHEAQPSVLLLILRLCLYCGRFKGNNQEGSQLRAEAVFSPRGSVIPVY